MNKLRYRYYRLIESLDPYEDISQHYKLTLNQMLYNLIEIKKDWKFEEGGKENTALKELIEAFKIRGYKPAL